MDRIKTTRVATLSFQNNIYSKKSNNAIKRLLTKLGGGKHG